MDELQRDRLHQVGQGQMTISVWPTR